jgi:Protein of unknown function (DUF4199)
MSNSKAILKKIAYNYGVILGVISIFILVIMYAFNLDKNWAITIISIGSTILVFVYGIKAFKKENDNFLSVQDAIKVGLAIAVISGVIGAVYAYFHYSYIYPEFIENIREEAMAQNIENPDLDEETLSKIESFTNIFTSPFMLATFSLIGSLFFGFIISMITGAIIKRKRPVQR